MNSHILFPDVIGPVMIGPSSSHTAGACRIANVARSIYGKEPKKVEIYLHGSFAKTYKGHGTDRALIAGLLGFSTKDPRIIHSMELAQEAGLEFSFHHADLGPCHPNTARIDFIEEGEKVLSVKGSSIGGGQMRIVEIDGIQIEFDGKLWMILANYPDRANMILDITECISHYSLNIATFRVSRADNRATLFAEIDQPIPDGLLKELEQIEGLETVRVIPAIG